MISVENQPFATHTMRMAVGANEQREKVKTQRYSVLSSRQESGSVTLISPIGGIIKYHPTSASAAACPSCLDRIHDSPGQLQGARESATLRGQTEAV